MALEAKRRRKSFAQSLVVTSPQARQLPNMHVVSGDHSMDASVMESDS